jgi:IS1 family transposase
MRCGVLLKKNQARIWFAFDRKRWKLIDCSVWNRGLKTWKDLRNKIKRIPCKYYASDYWRVLKNLFLKPGIYKQKEKLGVLNDLTEKWDIF